MEANFRLRLSVLPVRLAVCRLPPDHDPPRGSMRGSFWSVTRTDEEVSVVTDVDAAPDGGTVEKPWACLKIDGPLDLGLVGVLESITRPLVEARVSLFALSTFDTDYILVRERDLPRALRALAQCGHLVRE